MRIGFTDGQPSTDTAPRHASQGADAGLDLPSLVGESSAMRSVIELVRRVAPSNSSVLLTGESGAGKSLVARLLHAGSRRSTRPLLTVNAGETPETLLDCELFGYVRGVFPGARADRVGLFEQADAGTLFLDEVSNLPPDLQPKLLRALDSGEFSPLGSCLTRRAHVRLLVATNADLDAAVSTGRFRTELLRRLRTIEIHLPPLRDRREDIPALAGV